jgi:hypothetical protein
MKRGKYIRILAKKRRRKDIRIGLYLDAKTSDSQGRKLLKSGHIDRDSHGLNI